MAKTKHNDNTVREYLLGRISDEEQLARIEELLFADEEFCTLAEITEDALINDYVFSRLKDRDLTDFEKTLETSRDRREKVAVTRVLVEKAAAPAEAIENKNPSLLESIHSFFKKPLYVGAFAVTLIGVVLLSLLVLTRQAPDDLADLRSLYRSERPTESRISSFEYAPLMTLRGNAEEREAARLRKIEINLLDIAESKSNARTYHNLGVFYLAQRKFPEAIAPLEKALTFNDKDVLVLNDLGSAYFEKAKIAPAESRLENLTKSLEIFSRAYGLSPDFLAALFNRSLCLQELRLYQQARESWTQYLEKDSLSGWAEEARRNLVRIEELKTTVRTKEQILNDFLSAFRRQDDETAWKVNSQTREILSGIWLPDQLSRQIVEARSRGDSITAEESYRALIYIGDLEKSRNGDFFVSEFAANYASNDKGRVMNLIRTKYLLSDGYRLTTSFQYGKARDSFAQAKEGFARLGNLQEEMIAEYWIAFCEIFLAQTSSTEYRLTKLAGRCLAAKYIWLRAVCLIRLGNYFFLQDNYSLGFKHYNEAFQIVRQIDDLVSLQKTGSEIAYFYQSIGETSKAFTFLSLALPGSDQYFESPMQSWRNYGNVFDLLKESGYPISARDFSKENVEIAKRNLSGTSLLVESSVNLSDSYSLLGEFESAIEVAKENLRSIETIPDNETRTIKSAFVKRQIGDNYRLLNDCKAAIANYDQAIDLNANIGYEKLDSYFARKGRLVCYMKLDRMSDFENELGQVTEFSDKFRSEILNEEERNIFFDREQDIPNIAADYYLQNGDGQKAFQVLENAKARSLLDLVQTADRTNQNEKHEKAATALQISEIQSRVPEGLQILQYAVLEEELAVWLISESKFEVFRLPINRKDLEQKVMEFLDRIEARSPEAQPLGREIFEILVKPALGEIADTKQLCVVPDGILYRLPFAALWSRETDSYLIEEITLSYAPSSSSAILLSEKAAALGGEDRLFVVGDPEFARADYPLISPLYSARKEAEEIAALYSNSIKLLGRDATRSAVSDNLSRTNIFHFAGHYLTNRVSPESSRLLLTPNSDTSNDGEMSAEDILKARDIRLKLAVLSACETGIDRFYKGEGAVGLARTFLAVGTPVVIASHWKVESDSTAELMLDFHRHRSIGKQRTAEALRLAQVDMITHNNNREPYFWAGFSVIGGFSSY